MSDLKANNAMVQVVEFYSTALKEAHERERQLGEYLKMRTTLPREVIDLVRSVRAVLQAHHIEGGDSPIHDELEALHATLKEYDARLGGVEPARDPAREG